MNIESITTIEGNDARVEVMHDGKFVIHTFPLQSDSPSFMISVCEGRFRLPTTIRGVTGIQALHGHATITLKNKRPTGSIKTEVLVLSTGNKKTFKPRSVQAEIDVGKGYAQVLITSVQPGDTTSHNPSDTRDQNLF